jgi:hypothetical protein
MGCAILGTVIGNRPDTLIQVKFAPLGGHNLSAALTGDQLELNGEHAERV